MIRTASSPPGSNLPGCNPPASNVVIGAAGGVGSALAALLEQRGHHVLRMGRGLVRHVDLLDESSIREAAGAAGPGLGLVIDATGFLHDARFTPEKRLADIDAAQMAYHFAVNATGPALLMKHFLPLLAREGRAVFATLSARVGSIADNRLGGWTSYRASKAALNQIVRTAAIELARTRPEAVCVALHPGTVATALSAPFAKAGLAVQSPEEAAGRLMAVIDALTPAQSGMLLDQHGRQIAF
jgi:NAD(P)-dependent dehydrogenase (short-subunit alcohol dehydrogenase family)